MAYSPLIPQNIDLTLDRVLSGLDAVGNPQDRLPPVVHVAGTNGKGSTIAFLRALLEGEGYKIHVYTSPHLIRLNERIKIAGQDISDNQLAQYCRRIKEAAPGITLSHFEELTIAAFLAFSEHAADFCLIEVGLGGRLDATNVVHSAVSVITSISSDHTDYLGSTLREIAYEKSGILKYKVPVVCANQKSNEALKVISEQARVMHCPWVLPVVIPPGTSLGLAGGHQYENAAGALAAAQILLPHVKKQQFISHLKNVQWPGRLQRLLGSYDIWVDGAHNQDSMEVLAVEVQKWKDQGIHLIVAVTQLANRSEELFSPLFNLADDVYHIDMKQGERFRRMIKGAKKSLPINEALSYFMQPEYNNSRILFTGSLYMVGEVLKIQEMIDGSFK